MKAKNSFCNTEIEAMAEWQKIKEEDKGRRNTKATIKYLKTYKGCFVR